jgi:hypothetical protein
MDSKEKNYNADAVLAELRESLKNINEPQLSTALESTNDTISISNNGYDYTINSQDTITLSNTITNGGYAFGPFTTGGTYTINSGTGISNASPWATVNASTKIQLEGEDADIEINGKSLAKTIQVLEERLNILVPNPKLEKEWEELKALGDQYRALEAKLKEQTEMWKKLKEMPPPQPLY